MGPPCRDDRGLYPAGPPCRDSRGQPCPVGPPCRNSEGLCSLGPPCKDSAVLCPVGSPCGDAGWGHPPRYPHTKMLGDNCAPQDPHAGILVGCALWEPRQGFWGGCPLHHPVPRPPRIPRRGQGVLVGPLGWVLGLGAGSGHSRVLSLSRRCLVCESCHQLQIPSTSNEQCHQ